MDRRIKLAAGLLLTAYFCYFARPALTNGFNVDDPMNLYTYYQMSWWELARGLVTFDAAVYRPMGGVLYKAVYDRFGYDPYPLHVALAAILLGNVFLARRVGELAGGTGAGLLCALATAYHPRLPHLLYLPAYLYDVLCFSFYFAALAVYIAGRERDGRIGWRRAAAVLALQAAALQSKEMAATLPAALLLYEALWRGRGKRQWLPALLVLALTAVFLFAKSRGPEALSNLPEYRPVLSVGHVMGEQARYLNELFFVRYERPFFTPWRTAALWTALLALAAAVRRPRLAWAVALAAASPMPVAVLSGRGGACLYIPLAFWALAAAMLAAEASAALARAAAPDRRRPLVAAALLLVLAVVYGRMVVRRNRETPAAMAQPTLLGWRIASEVRRVLPRPRPRSQVLYLTDVADVHDTLFISELLWGDRSVHVRLQHASRLPPEEIDKMDYLLEFDSGQRLRLVRGPDR
jgi:hypothetical protein